MWVFCGGMQRAGSTVQYQITAEIVERLDAGKRLGYLLAQDMERMLEEQGASERYVVVKTHDYYKELQKIVNRGDAKIVYIYRDIRDVVVSLLRKTHRKYWRFMLSGDLDNLLHEHDLWINNRKIHVARYENMVEDLIGEVLSIAAFLELSISRNLAQQIAQKLSLDEQKKTIQSYDYESEYLAVGKKHQHKVSSETLLHDNHIYSGAVEQWKNDLSPLQTGIIELFAFDWLVKNNYKISQTWLINPVAVYITQGINRLLRFVRRLRKK